MSFALGQVGVGWNNKIVHTAAKYNVPGAVTPSSVWTQTALVFSAPHQRFSHRCLTPKKRVEYPYPLFDPTDFFTNLTNFFEGPYSPGSPKNRQHSAGLPHFYK